jgi:hypothetical protein
MPAEGDRLAGPFLPRRQQAELNDPATGYGLGPGLVTKVPDGVCGASRWMLARCQPGISGRPRAACRQRRQDVRLWQQADGSTNPENLE